jgi:phage gp16-like protein
MSNVAATRPDARARLVRLIHVAKRELNMDDDSYRAMLSGCVKKDSASTMTVPELERVVERMKRLGFRVKRTPGSAARPLADDGQSKKIRALWLSLHEAGAVRNSSESALASYVQRQTGVSALQWLTPAQASMVIESLKKWLARTERRGA